MSEPDRQPSLELPKRPVARRPIFDRRSVFFSACVLVLFAVLVWLQRGGGRGAGVGPSAVGGLSAAKQRQLAMRLEERNLASAAAEAWREYIRVAQPGRDEAADIYFRIGKLHEQAREYQQAIANYYRAEEFIDTGGSELARSIAVRVRDCFERLGQYGDLGRELASRVELGKPAEQVKPGEQIVAQIGPNKLTRREFDRLVERVVDSQVEQRTAMVGGASPEQIEQMRRAMLKQVASPQAKQQMLSQLVGQTVLARKARAEGLDKDPQIQEQLSDMTEALLAQALLAREVKKRVQITEGDVERFYEANRERFKEPARARFAEVVLATRQEAEQVLQAARGGADFAELAREKSIDAESKARGGQVEGWVRREGDHVPEIGRDKELHDLIWATPKGAVAAKVVKSDKGWHVIKVTNRVDERQRSFDEVKEEVRVALLRAKESEVTQEYLNELFAAQGVRLYPEAFSSVGSAGEGPSAGQSRAAAAPKGGGAAGGDAASTQSAPGGPDQSK